MRNKLLTFAGALALLAVLGHFYAKPLLAQVRAALVQDVDQPVRNFVQIIEFPIQVPTGTTTSLLTSSPLYTVPTGKRLAVDSLTLFNQDSTNAVPVRATLEIASGGSCTAGLPGFAAAILPVSYHGSDAVGTQRIWGSQNLTVYADQGQCLLITLSTNTPMTAGQGYFASMSGHLISLP